MDGCVCADICSPELAKFIRGETDELQVDDKDDIWALGVTTLYLSTGKHPFTVVDSPDLSTKLETIASIQEKDITATISKAGVKKATQLESFLLKCLELERAQRASAEELKQSGYISGSSATQFQRDGGAVMREVKDGQDAANAKLDTIQQSIEEMKQQLGLVVSSMETLRRTVVNLNLDKSPVPLMFVIELQPTEDEQVLAAIEARDAKALAKHATSLFGRVKNVFNAKGTTEKIQAAVDELIGGSQRTMTLRLICQYTMEPVGAGYKIHAPREFVPKMLPALCASSLRLHKDAR